MSENRDKRAANAAVGVGAAAGLTALNTNRIANTVNERYAAHYRNRANAVATGSYGLDRAGNPVPKIDTSRRVPGERRLRNEEKSINRENAKRKAGVVNSLNAKAKKLPFTPFRRGVLMQGANALALPAIALGARYSVDKADVRRRDVDAALAGAVGGGLVYQAAGYSLKPIDRKFERKVKADDDLTRQVREYRKKVGLPANAPAGHQAWRPYFRNYPKNIPGARLKRALAVTHTGRSGTALTGAAAAVGALGAARMSHKQRQTVNKSNVRQYPYLPETIREDQIPSTRRNPINPLMMYSSGLIMTDSKLGRGRKLKGKARRRIGNEELQYTGGRAMLYSPLGIGALR